MIKNSPEQRRVVDRVLHCVRHKIPAFISVDGKSGRGKTTVAEFLAYYLRAHDFVVQTAASTGQAALNHPLGCTAHSLFGLPLDDGPQISSNVSPNSDRAKLLRATHLFQWDEWPNRKCQCWDAAVGLVEELTVVPLIPHNWCFGKTIQLPGIKEP